MKVDLCYSAKNRMEFTRESFSALKRNTNWDLVREFVIYDDGSEDGTFQFLVEQVIGSGAEIRHTNFGSPVDVHGDYMKRIKPGAPFFAKTDNDAMLPPRWLDISLEIFDRHPELQVLGLEYRGIPGELPYTYQPEGILDGLFVARSGILDIARESPLVANNKYWGWANWIASRGLRCGWVKPSIPVFLLDRLYFDPWISYSLKYESSGWQRAWHRYTPANDDLWRWCPWIQAT